MQMSPAMRVTVLLPLVPVTAMILGMRETACGKACAKSSMSPVTGTPCAIAAAIAGVRRSMPGLIAIKSAARNDALLKSPHSSVTAGNSRRTTGACGGAARVSAADTIAPRRASQRVIESPVSPSPSTKTFLPLTSMRVCLHCLAQFQSRQTNEDQHHRDDPEAHHDLVFFPAL